MAYIFILEPTTCIFTTISSVFSGTLNGSTIIKNTLQENKADSSLAAAGNTEIEYLLNNYKDNSVKPH